MILPPKSGFYQNPNTLNFSENVVNCTPSPHFNKFLGDPFINTRYEPMVNDVFDEYLGIIEENKNDIFIPDKKRRHLHHIHRKRRHFKKSYNAKA